MTAPLPTSVPLQQELAKLTERLRGTLHRPDLTLDRLLRLQHEASTAPTQTVGDGKVLYFPTPDVSGSECYEGEPPEAA